MPSLLITGASGTVGAATLAALAAAPHQATILGGQHVADASTLPHTHGSRHLDFTDAATFPAALDGIDRLLLVRPPHLADVDRDFAPFVEACVAAGRPHVVFLSLQGAERNPITPHAKIEQLIDSAGLHRTFLRPSFFMQNLTAAHLADVRDRDEIDIPAGGGRTAFIDARDIGAVAALALLDPGSVDPAPELTGSEALTYSEVAAILSDVLGRPIRYRRSTLTGFVARRVRRGDAFDYAAVMGAIYTVARLGRAGALTDTLPRLLGRPPIRFRQFAEEHAALWERTP
jgi:uncharacterized protein YbjT (DUF2867 family)